MIKVSVMYPHTPGARFDHAYYREKHVALLLSLVGDSCRQHSIDKGIGGGRPGSPPLYEAMCHLVFDSVESFQAGFGPHAKTLMADTPNYTDIAPVMQISEVVA